MSQAYCPLNLIASRDRDIFLLKFQISIKLIESDDFKSSSLIYIKMYLKNFWKLGHKENSQV